MEFNFKKGNPPPPHKKNCICFRCSHVSWNKGTKGLMPIPWNKETKGIMKPNKTSFKKGQTPFNKGKKLSEKHIENLRKSHQGPRPWRVGVPVLGMRGEKHHAWKGDEVGYVGLHTWLDRNFGTPNKCENKKCVYPRKNFDGEMMIKPKLYHWANKNKKYNRDRENWLMLCPSCHRLFDNGKINL